MRCLEQTHPGKSFAYSFEKNGVQVVYATDQRARSRARKTPTRRNETRDVLRRLPEQFVRFVAGADLLIADGQYTDEEYREKRGWGHARATTAVDLAVQAGVKQCAIFHHDPMHSDDDVDVIIEGCQARARDAGSDVVRVRRPRRSHAEVLALEPAGYVERQGVLAEGRLSFHPRSARPAFGSSCSR